MTGFLGDFCTTPLWDYNATWNATVPEFTSCFQQTVCVWVPCGILWLLAPWEIHRISKWKEQPNPWLVTNLCKLIFNVLIILLTVIHFSSSLYSHFHNSQTPVAKVCGLGIQVVTYVGVLSITLFARRRGVTASIGLPLFWIINTLFLLITSWSCIWKVISGEQDWDTMDITIPLLSTVISIIQVIFYSCPEPKHSRASSRVSCPVKNYSLIPRIFFWQMSRLFLKGYRMTLSVTDLLPFCSDLHSAYVFKSFQAAISPVPKVHSARYQILENHCDETAVETPSKRKTEKQERSLLCAIFRTCWRPLLAGSVLELLQTSMSFSIPLALSLLIDFVQGNDLQWHGYVYAVMFFAIAIARSLFDSHQIYFTQRAGIQVKSALTSAVYCKIFRLSSSARLQYMAGEITNLMSVDTEELYDFVPYFHQLWSVPLTAAMCLYYLWTFVGPACLAGLAVFALGAPITVFVARIADKYQEHQMEMKDERLRQMSEILNGIKVLKLYAWELPFMKRVLETRNNELSYLRKFDYLESGFAFLWSMAPSLVALSTFGTYVLYSENNILDPKTAFASLSVFGLLKFPMGILPDMLSRLVRVKVSLKRIENFLASEELDPHSVGTEPSEGDAVTLQDATLSWDRSEGQTLREISLHIQKSSLVAVIGTIGSGKSSLLSAILGEMHKLDGSVDVQGSLAYVPQQAWIQNATLRQNVTFTRSLTQQWYDTVIEACALKPDLETLPARDLTEIGERGINLSGGQKQRVSLARAVYQDADIYLLDDPLSAVDAHVATHLFQKVIGPKGLLKHKTRILVTHNIACLPEVDTVIVIENGSVVEMGTYAELANSQGLLAALLQRDGNGKEGGGDTQSVGPKSRADILRQKSVETGKGQYARAVSTQSVDSEVGRLIEEEEIAVGKIHMKVYVDYVRQLGWVFFFFTLLAFGVTDAFEVGSGMWLSLWSEDAALPGTHNVQNRNLRLGVYGGLIFGQGVTIVAGTTLMFIGALRAAARFHKQLLQQVLKAPLAFFDTTPVGRIINRFSRDIAAVDISVPTNMNFCLITLLWIPCIVAVMSLVSPYFLLALLGLGIIYYFAQKLYLMTSRQIRRFESASRSPVYSNFSETIAGVSTIRAYRAYEYFIQRAYKRSDHHLNCYINGIMASRWLEVGLVIVGSCSVLVIAMLVVFERSTIGAGLAGLALTYATEVTDFLGWFVHNGAELEISVVALERIQEYCGLTPEAPWEIENTRPPPSWPEKGRIQIKDFTTCYRTGLPAILHNISLNISPSEKVGVVGRTGAGKSSLVLSLFRIIEPTEGCIEIDGLNIHELGLHQLRSKLTIIPQDPVLFAGSLRMNLDPWNEHTDDELWSALEHAHLKQHVCGLADGLAHAIAEGGENLSAGQRQLVCLTRALLRNTRILVLDEATAAVDVETDHLIQTTIREEFKDSTVITIAHRLHTIMDYDRVIVLSNGVIVEEGHPDALRKDAATAFHAMAKEAGLA